MIATEPVRRLACGCRQIVYYQHRLLGQSQGIQSGSPGGRAGLWLIVVYRSGVYRNEFVSKGLAWPVAAVKSFIINTGCWGSHRVFNQGLPEVGLACGCRQIFYYQYRLLGAVTGYSIRVSRRSGWPVTDRGV